MSDSISEINQFYKNKTIFLTGGTGFVGKVTVEKLLRVCAEIKRIYVLVRPKKGKTPQERHESFFDFPCFEPLKKLRRDFRTQLVLIEGDCCKKNLGIGESDLEMIKKHTNLVIHAAANVRFDQSFQEAANNVKGVVEMVEIAKQMPKLSAFIYVSTAYSNCIYPDIDEKFYAPPMTAQNLFDVLDSFDSETIEKMTPGFLDEYPNTYVYTKAICEDYVKNNTTGMNCAVVRPSIVCSSAFEPIPGWIDNFYGVVGIVAGAALGAIRSLHGSLSSSCNIVPVDFVANIIVAVGWDIVKNPTPEAKIFNYTGYSKQKTATWKNFIEEIEKCAWDYPTEKQVWYYSFKIRENALWHKICVFFLHTVLAYVADFFLIVCFQKPLAVQNYARLDKMLESLSYFSTRNWTWSTKNVSRLWSEMSDYDRELFNFNMDDLVWERYAKNSIIGGRVYLLKDPLETVPKGRKKMALLAMAHYLSLALFWFLIYKLARAIIGLFY